jgi:hypothetical protein
VADFFPGKVTEADLKFGTDKFYYIQDLYQAAQGRKDWNLNAKQFVTFIGEVEMLINSNFQLVAAAE